MDPLRPWNAIGVVRGGLAMVLALSACRDEPSTGPEGGSAGSSDSGPSVVDSSGSVPTACEPGEVRACYEGPPGTADIGPCRSGQQACDAAGAQWSPCEGEVWPQEQERCDTPEDDDCDGSTLCAPQAEWAQYLPGAVRRLAATPEGGVVAAGQGYGGLFEDQELVDLFIIQLGPDGALQWGRSVIEPNLQYVDELLVGPDGEVTLVGFYESTPDFGGIELPTATGYDAFAVRYSASGELLWANTLNVNGYVAAALGPDGSTYVAGGSIYTEFDGEQVSGDFFIGGIDPSGTLSWLTTGSGSFGVSEEGTSLTVTETGDVVALMVLGDTGGLQLGGMPIELLGYEPVALRLSPEGTPLGAQRLAEEPPASNGMVWAGARSGGVMTASSIIDFADDRYYSGVLLTSLDDSLEVLSSHRVGEQAWLRDAAAHPDGTTVLGIEFDGSLQLGPIGVAAADYLTQAVAVVDDQGHARWVEVLHGTGFSELYAVAASPDGAVLVAGETGGASSLAGAIFAGPFIAKLRP